MNIELITIKNLVERANKARDQIKDVTQAKLDLVAADIIYTFSRENMAKEVAELAHKETDMGRIDSKISKLRDKLPAIFHQIKSVKTTGIIAENNELGLIQIAKPLGTIAALIPSTNSEATPIFKGVLSLRAKNAIIFAPHPASKQTTTFVVDKMREILEKHNLPLDLFIVIEDPSKTLTQQLMNACDITMATGSGEMVKAAYSSGKPAYGVGAGNAVVVVDETAHLEDATNKIVQGKLGDWASGCSAENALVIQESIYSEVIELLKQKGGYLVNAEEKTRLQAAMWINGQLNREIVARPAKTIGAVANLAINEDTQFILVEERGIGKDFPFSGEKMSVVLTLYKYQNFEEAIEKVNEITLFSGRGHSCGIHSFNDQNILRLAYETETTKVLVRQPHGVGNSGATFNGLANTFSLGCGTWGGNIVSENMTQKHYFNLTWLSKPIEVKALTDQDIYGHFLRDIEHQAMEEII